MLLSKLKIENGRVKTKDGIRITIEVDGEVNKTSNKEIPIQGENYKGYEIKPDEETGEFDIYSTGGAIVAHTATIELAKNYIDTVDVDV